jgi:hypothetical protein
VWECHEPVEKLGETFGIAFLPPHRSAARRFSDVGSAVARKLASGNWCLIAAGGRLLILSHDKSPTLNAPDHSDVRGHPRGISSECVSSRLPDDFLNFLTSFLYLVPLASDHRDHRLFRQQDIIFAEPDKHRPTVQRMNANNRLTHDRLAC